jgi:signal peptidase I
MTSTTPRIWWLAATLSMFVPGLGQVYNGQLWRGILVCLAMLGVGLGSLVAILVRGSLFLWLALPMLLLLLIHIWIITDAMLVARRLSDYLLGPVNRIAVYVIFSVLVLGAFQISQMLVVRLCFTSHKITAVSLDGTLEPGDTVLCNRLAFGLVDPDRSEPSFWWRDPDTNEVVLYRSSDDPQQVLPGRVIASAGQKVELGQAALLVDGAVTSFFANGFAAAGRHRRSFKVPDGKVCILNDSVAADRIFRYETVVVPRVDVIGQPMLVYWSWDEAEQQVRLERIGIPVF